MFHSLYTAHLPFYEFILDPQLAFLDLDKSVPAGAGFIPGTRFVQCLFDHLNQGRGHHLPRGGRADQVDPVVDPYLRYCDNLEHPAQLRVLVTAIDQSRHMFAEPGKSVCEPDGLWTVNSVRGSEDADPDLLVQGRQERYHLGRQVRPMSRSCKNPLEKGPRFFTLGITVIP